MRTPHLLLHLLLLLAPLSLILAAPAPLAVPAPDDVLVPKGATLNARSIPELLAMKKANEKRRLNFQDMVGELRRGE
ncbi:hypothetical protein IMSHALPRED_007852 [Imshaugia aleurites]|uniref:Uncharacterized protein n=1 Tax=Imshaugia aleurites TaxID=172621 RepID=A0A8H3FTU9_9LECA|nr:hypothetical protein IMSHALPRED_007852 [Imshaugia aleurites]